MAIKGSTVSGRDILQRDFLCIGNESTLLECTYFTHDTRDCPEDHSEDAAVKCNGMFSIVVLVFVLTLSLHSFESYM